MKLIISLLFITVVQTCQPIKPFNNEIIMWVNSMKTDCSGIGKMTCLKVQKNETLNLSGEWELFYSTVIGFEYESRFIYKLKVREEHLENVPSDASAIKYTLIKVLEKKEDKRLSIHDIWVLESLNGNTFEGDTINTRPQIEINITKMRISGSDGCNNIAGSISKMDNEILEFGILTQTQMACPDMKTPMEFSKTLTETKSYKKVNTQLILLNESGEATLIFKKAN